MQVLRRSRARLFTTVFAFSVLAACGDDNPTEVGNLAGTYTATTFRVTPDGEAPLDVLAGGGTLSVTLASNNTVSGTLFLPASITGDVDQSTSMTGTVVRSGNTVKFQQSTDTFVRDLTWTIGNDQLSVVDQRAGAAIFTITLTRQ